MSQERINEIWKSAVKKIAQKHGVDAAELLQKVPDLFPVGDPTLQEIDTFLCEFILRTDKMTVPERTVCMWAGHFVQDAISQEIEYVHSLN